KLHRRYRARRAESDTDDACATGRGVGCAIVRTPAAGRTDGRSGRRNLWCQMTPDRAAAARIDAISRHLGYAQKDTPVTRHLRGAARVRGAACRLRVAGQSEAHLHTRLAPGGVLQGWYKSRERVARFSWRGGDRHSWRGPTPAVPAIVAVFPTDCGRRTDRRTPVRLARRLCSAPRRPSIRRRPAAVATRHLPWPAHGWLGLRMR